MFDIKDPKVAIPVVLIAGLFWSFGPYVVRHIDEAQQVPWQYLFTRGIVIFCPFISRSISGPKGIIIKIKNEGTNARIGAKIYIALSAFRGMICSFSRSFIASASVCKIPKGPALSGPTRDCIPATTFLSNQINKIVLVSSKPKIKKALTREMIISIDI